MKRTRRSTRNSNPPTNIVQPTPAPIQQHEEQKAELEYSEHTLEIISILVAADGQFVDAMREADPVLTGKLLRMLIKRRFGNEGQANKLPNDDIDINYQQLSEILPKCDDGKLNEIAEFLLTTQQIEHIEDTGIPNEEQQRQNTIEAMETLPYNALMTLLTWNSYDRAGEAAMAFRNELLNSGIIAILLDGLSHYSKQANRFSTEKQLSFIEFQNVRTSDNNNLQPPLAKKQARVVLPDIMPQLRNRGRRGRGRGAAQVQQQMAATSSQSRTDSENEERLNTLCIEALFKVLNSFLSDSHLIQMDERWLSLFYRSCLRNFVRAYLMNGDLGEVVDLSPTYGSLFQLLITLASANPGKNKEDLKQKKNGSKDADNSALLYAFDVILGDDPDEKASATGLPSSSSAAAVTQPILEQLGTFSRKIEDHFKLLLSATEHNQDEAAGEELMTLSSLSSLCENIISTVIEQKSVLQQNIPTETPTPTNASDIQPQSSQLANLPLPGQPGTSSRQAQAQSDSAFADKYCKALKDLQFATIPFDGEGQQLIPHHFRPQFGGGVSQGMANQRLRRIGKELFALRSEMPLTVSSSVFVRTSEEHMDALKVLITGPADTPYENGCFEFDFFLDAHFPTKPPKVQFMTTGNGTVRFNPNLYNCGKVCLSLLGTWPGDNKDQEWHADRSTINQVITSIQGLILVPDPYFNEPGFTRLKGQSAGDANSLQYNIHIQFQTIRWAITEQLRNPPRGFEDVVRKHFWLKREQILAQVDRWGAQHASVKPLKGPLEQEFKKLELAMAKQQEEAT